MKVALNIFLMCALTIVLGQSDTFAQNEAQRAQKSRPVGFEDKNHDGINDRFRDADGDGVNDVTGKPYQHSFSFKDKNGDGVNDLWVDQDGDGVNDLSHTLGKRQRAKIRGSVLDDDEDGRNDITGVEFTEQDLMGHKFGFIDERTGKIQGKFLDDNGNGLDDRIEAIQMGRLHRNRDLFVDEDGDGICDGRGDALRRRHRGKRGGKKR